MKRGRVKILLLLLVLGGVAAWGWHDGWWGNGNRETPTINGNVEVREVELAFRVGGRIATLEVDEGDRVSPGMLVATLDDAPYVDALASARADIDVAGAALARQRNGNRPQEILEAEASLRAAEAVVVNADKEFARRRDLQARGFSPVANVDAARAALDAAKALVDERRAALSRLREGSRADDIAQSAAGRDAAVAEARRAGTQLSDTRLMAPLAGTIVTRVREPGAMVGMGEPVLTLAIDNPVRVRAYVPGPVLGTIRPGQKVTVRTDDGAALAGTIGFISPTAEFTPRTVETESQRADLVYRIRITVADARGQLRQGQPVTVDLGPIK